jgi:hypothetical protein
VLPSDDLNRVAEAALNRVQPQANGLLRATHCHVDHGDIARAGVEEGLKLALRLLQGLSGVAAVARADRPAGSHMADSSCPRGAIESAQARR